MTTDWFATLVQDRPVVLDGAWGTEMQALGLPPGQLADRWNLSHPERVESVAAAYADAGSRIVLTNTFQSNRIALGADVDVAEVNREGARLSRRGAGDRARVFGSIGPTNTMMVAGDIEPAVLRSAFSEQAAALVDGGADGIVIETMSDVEEASLAVDAAVGTGVPVVVCMTFDSGKERNRTMTGVRPSEAAKRLADTGASAIGANCGVGVDQAVPICESLVAATALPVWIKANAGLPELVGREVVYPMGPDEFAGHARRLADAGATFIGGCCGTTPAFIAAIAAALH